MSHYDKGDDQTDTESPSATSVCDLYMYINIIKSITYLLHYYILNNNILYYIYIYNTLFQTILSRFEFDIANSLVF